jgi:hypothetical protein
MAVWLSSQSGPAVSGLSRSAVSICVSTISYLPRSRPTEVTKRGRTYRCWSQRAGSRCGGVVSSQEVCQLNRPARRVRKMANPYWSAFFSWWCHWCHPARQAGGNECRDHGCESSMGGHERSQDGDPPVHAVRVRDVLHLDGLRARLGLYADAELRIHEPLCGSAVG